MAVTLPEKVERLDRALTRAKIPHAFGGALALAYYATPRATVDIDVNVFVGPEEYGPVAGALKRLGVTDIPPDAAAVERGQLRAWWGSNPVDVFFAYDPIHERMRESIRRVPFGKTTIPILAPEHLLVAKAAFDRPKDWLDIEQMLVAVHDLDVAEVRRWMTHLVGKRDARAIRVERLTSKLRS